MKPNTPNHPKFEQLRTALGVPKYAVVGILETLWNTTAKFFPDDAGIGRWSAKRIAGAIGWEGDAKSLVKALLDTGWIDRVRDARKFVIHDWDDHKPEYLRDRERKAAYRRKNPRQNSVSRDSPGTKRERPGQSAPLLCSVSDDDEETRGRANRPEPLNGHPLPEPDESVIPLAEANRRAAASATKGDELDVQVQAYFRERFDVGLRCGPKQHGHMRDCVQLIGWARTRLAVDEAITRKARDPTAYALGIAKSSEPEHARAPPALGPRKPRPPIRHHS